jgi:hypothetical protein
MRPLSSYRLNRTPATPSGNGNAPPAPRPTTTIWRSAATPCIVGFQFRESAVYGIDALDIVRSIAHLG